MRSWVAAAGLLGTILIWLGGGGAAPLMLVSVVVAVVIASRLSPIAQALPVVVIWSAASWLVLPSLIRLFPVGELSSQALLGISAMVPILVGLSWRALCFSSGRVGPGSRRGPGGWWPFVGVGCVLVVVCIALLRFGYRGLSWVMSGDSRNHLTAAINAFPSDLNGQGVFLDPSSAFFGFLAVATSAPQKEQLGEFAVVQSGLMGMFGYVLAAVCLASLSSGFLAYQLCRRRGRWTTFASCGASIAPLLGIGIGVGLLDGFVPALMAIPITTCSLAIAISLPRVGTSSPIRLAMIMTLGAGGIVVLFTWSYMAVAFGALALYSVLVSWKFLRGSHRAVLVGVAFLIGVGLVKIIPLWIGWILKDDALALGGSIVAPSPYLLAIIPLVASVTVLSLHQRLCQRALIPYLMATIAVGAMVGFMAMQPSGPAVWTYYAAKLTWMWTASTLGLMFLPLLLMEDLLKSVNPALLKGRFRSNLGRRELLTKAVLLAGMLLILLIIGRFSVVTSPVWTSKFPLTSGVSWIARGWNAPTATAVGDFFVAAQSNRPAVVWNATDHGNDRLANFWLNTMRINAGDDFRGWAYTEYAQIGSLCELLDRNSDRIIFTRDTTLEDQVRSACRIIDPEIEFLPPVPTG